MRWQEKAVDALARAIYPEYFRDDDGLGDRLRADARLYCERALRAALPLIEVTPEMVERVTMTYLDRRGFRYVTTPEDGQDAYDITMEARDDMRAALEAAFSPSPAKEQTK